MPPSFEIFPARHLVLVTYRGTAIIADSARAFGAYISHADFAPGQRQLVDLSGVTGFERDYARLFDLQLRKSDVLGASDAQTQIVYYAPQDIALQMATLIVRSWNGVQNVHPVIVQTTEGDALRRLGAQETSFAALRLAEAGGKKVSG